MTEGHAAGDPAAADEPPAGTEQQAEQAEEPADAAPRRQTVRERADARREAKLDEVQRQVESGSLNIRQMSDKERERYGPPPEEPRSRRGRQR